MDHHTGYRHQDDEGDTFWQPSKQKPTSGYQAAHEQDAEDPLFPPLPRPGAPLFGATSIVKTSRTAVPPVIILPNARDEAGEAGIATQKKKRRRFAFTTIVRWRRQHIHQVAAPPLRVSYANRIIIGVTALLLVAIFGARPFYDALASARNAQRQNAPILGSNVPVKTMTPCTPMSLDVDHPPPVVWAESAYVLDECTSATLFAKNPDEQLPMASTTKLMTAIVALSHTSPDKVITITPDATTIECTCMGLKTGEKYTLRDMLYGMIMLSGNDVAYAVAVGVAGDFPTFIRWMNETAVALGLHHTHYVNANGLDDDNHYSTAHDLAILGRYAMSIAPLQQIMNTRTFTIAATADHAVHNFENMHQPLWWYPGADGGKPGWTGAAQFVDVLSAERNGHHLLAVVMHSHNNWVVDIRNLLNWGFDDFSWISPRDINQQQYIVFADVYDHFSWDTPARSVVEDGSQRYYSYTGYAVSGAFLPYFDAHGGLTAFGFPKGMPLPGADGQLTQHFQQANIICNPANGACQTLPAAG